jgi:phosphate:Na+ symporter
MFSKDRFKNHLGNVLLGFAVLMFGMSVMSSSVAPLKESEAFINIITEFSNPLLSILVNTRSSPVFFRALLPQWVFYRH